MSQSPPQSTSTNDGQRNSTTMTQSSPRVSNVAAPTILSPGHQRATNSILDGRTSTSSTADPSHVDTQALPRPTIVRFYNSGTLIDHHNFPQIASILWPSHNNGEPSRLAQDRTWPSMSIFTGSTTDGAASNSDFVWNRPQNVPRNIAKFQKKAPMDSPVKNESNYAPRIIRHVGTSQRPKDSASTSSAFVWDRPHNVPKNTAASQRKAPLDPANTNCEACTRTAQNESNYVPQVIRTVGTSERPTDGASTSSAFIRGYPHNATNKAVIFEKKAFLDPPGNTNTNAFKFVPIVLAPSGTPEENRLTVLPRVNSNTRHGEASTSSDSNIFEISRPKPLHATSDDSERRNMENNNLTIENETNTSNPRQTVLGVQESELSSTDNLPDSDSEARETVVRNSTNTALPRSTRDLMAADLVETNIKTATDRTNAIKIPMTVPTEEIFGAVPGTSQEPESLRTSDQSVNKNGQTFFNRKMRILTTRGKIKECISKIREIQSRINQTDPEDKKRRKLRVMLYWQRKMKTHTEELKKLNLEKLQQEFSGSQQMNGEAIRTESAASDQQCTSQQVRSVEDGGICVGLRMVSVASGTADKMPSPSTLDANTGSDSEATSAAHCHDHNDVFSIDNITQEVANRRHVTQIVENVSPTVTDVPLFMTRVMPKTDLREESLMRTERSTEENENEPIPPTGNVMFVNRSVTRCSVDVTNVTSGSSSASEESEAPLRVEKNTDENNTTSDSSEQLAQINCLSPELSNPSPDNSSESLSADEDADFSDPSSSGLSAFTSPSIYNPSGRNEDVDLMQSLQIREARIRALRQDRERFLASVSRLLKYPDYKPENP